MHISIKGRSRIAIVYLILYKEPRMQRPAVTLTFLLMEKCPEMKPMLADFLRPIDCNRVVALAEHLLDYSLRGMAMKWHF